MKLMIDIPEEVVKAIQNGEDYRYDIHTAIAQGISVSTEGNLISRSELKEAINTWDKFACLPDCKLEPFRNLEHPEMFEPYIHFRDVIKAIDNATPVDTDLSKYSDKLWKEAYERGHKRGHKEGYELAILDGKTNYSRSQEWIPVSEGLPEIYKDVIVTDIEVSDTYVSRYIGDGYWECDNGPFKDRIIAWQEKPKPYKKEGDEK